MSSEIDLGPVIHHYEACLERHRDGSRAVDWKDEAGQALRFDVLAGLAPLAGRRVLDVGAGLGHLADYFEQRSQSVAYTGLDASRRMVEAARRRRPDLRFLCGDVRGGAAGGELPEAETFDVAIACGLFTVRASIAENVWWEYIREAIEAMFRRTTLGVAFNLMTPFADWRSPHLFHAELATVAAHCRSLSRHFAVRHDYPLYEYTVWLYHHSPWEGRAA